jgi:hypothetical protein
VIAAKTCIKIAMAKCVVCCAMDLAFAVMMAEWSMMKMTLMS